MVTLLTTLAAELSRPGGRAGPLLAHGASAPRLSGTDGLPTEVATFLAGVAETAPHLGRTMRRRDLAALLERDINDSLVPLATPPDDLPADELRRHLRHAKADASLLVALADLAGLWDMRQATAALSDFADACVEVALRAAWGQVAGHRKADIVLSDDGPVPGLAVIAMGKLGSRTLNYSSDIDLVVVFDGNALPLGEGDRMGARGVAVAVTQAMLGILSERTVDGYVFRTDMRLRPDPSSSALAISVPQAERYYEQQGQNWERAAYIKARSCAGDTEVGRAYLDVLRPFVWRRTLDFAALSDIRAVGQQIKAQVGNPDVVIGGADVKLGPGGIREAEFFCEVQQLIFGGRDERLRTAHTLDTLAALAKACHVPHDVAEDVGNAYRVLRDVEHRLQMVEDQPTQTMPQPTSARRKVATLYGASDLESFDATVLSALNVIHDAYAELFGPDEDDRPGSLVFTGVEDDPATIRTLTEMGFAEPSMVARTVRGWHQGSLPAAKSVRARELLTALVPQILQSCAQSGAPDDAFAAISRFLSVLPSGLGVFGLFAANPDVLADVVTLCAASPELTGRMGRRPSLVMALLAGEEDVPLPPPTDDLEGEMEIVRRHVQAGRLRAAAALTLGRGDPYETGASLSGLAKASLERLDRAVRRSLSDHGPPMAIVAFGRLGAECLTVASDLDLVFVYDGEPADSPTALKRVRRLTAALSAPTAEGLLYEVDMKLRPSGGAGPAAVGFSAFERYYAESAQSWELMALTKARVVLADDEVGDRLDALIDDMLAPRRNVFDDAAAMRARLLDGHPPRGPLDVKRMIGGLTDIDFIAQALTLAAGGRGFRATPLALRWHVEAGRLSEEEATTLLDAHALFEGVAQYARATFGTMPAGRLTISQEKSVRTLCRTEEPIHEAVEAAARAVADLFGCVMTEGVRRSA